MYVTYEKKTTGYVLGEQGSVQYDIAYDTQSPSNTLDLYLSHFGSDPMPLIVFLHGGAFVKGDKSRHIGGVLQALQRGYAVASVNYRLNQEAPYPAMLFDACEAIRYLKAHAKALHIDPDNLILWGDTHGGYLASVIGIEGAKGLLTYATKYPKQTLDVKGIISFYAPIDLYDFHKRQIASGNFLTVEGMLVDELTFQKKGNQLLTYLKSLDPLMHIDGSEPPFYLLHGCKDFDIPQSYSKKFHDVLKAHKVPCVLDMVEDGIHGIDFYDLECYNEPIMRFVDQIFRGVI